MSEAVDEYPCVGVCMVDHESGYCLGCGRPPLAVSFSNQGIVVEQANPHLQSPLGGTPKRDAEIE